MDIPDINLDRKKPSAVEVYKQTHTRTPKNTRNIKEQ